MPFIAFNSIAAKVVKATQTYTQLGESSRGFAGKARREVRATKRSWELHLRAMRPDEGYGLVQTLLGRGHGFPFDNTSMYSSGAVVPLVNSNVAQLLASDGGAIFCAKQFGAIAIDGGCTNLLSSNVATGTDTSATTTGFSAVDSAAISTSTTYSWQGSRVLKVIADSAVNAIRSGAKTDAIAVSNLTAYAGSVWVKAASAVSVRAYLRDETNAIDGTAVTVALAASTWTRIDNLLVTTGAAGSTLSLYVLEETADSGITFYCDGFQIETGSYSSAWVDGTRAASSLTYSPGLVTSFVDLTVNAWMTMPSPDVQRTWLTMASAMTGALLRLDTDGGAGPNVNLRFVTTGRHPTASDVVSIGSISRRVLHMVTVVLRKNPRSGQANKELWVDGVLVASSSVAAEDFPNLANVTALEIGARTGGTFGWTSGTIEELSLLPYAAGPTEILGWYGETSPQTKQSQLIMTGDLLRAGESIAVTARVSSVEHIYASDGNTYRQMREITCTVEEV